MANKHQLMSLASMVRESRILLPSSEEVDEETLKHLLDAAEKSVNNLYCYLNDRIANG